MKKYSKIIFICTGNTYLSPIAETMYRQFVSEEERSGQSVENLPEQCCSRGLVVLFPEPISPKVNVALSQHDRQPSNHEHAVLLEKSDLTEDTLVLTMTFSEKVTFLEKYSHKEVYTLGEFVGEDTDIIDPYGGEDELYDKCYNDIARRVHKVINLLEEGTEK